MSPPDYTGLCKVLYDWQTIIAGVVAFLGGLAAYKAGVIQAKATRQAADKQIAAIKSSLQANTMLSLMDKFDSKEFQEKLKNAAKACLDYLQPVPYDFAPIYVSLVMVFSCPILPCLPANTDLLLFACQR